MDLQPACGIETEVRRIDAVIKEYGSCLMKEEELKRLFANGDNDKKRFLLLATLAHERGWSFEFQPHNGDVRVTSLPALKTT
jgi:hypothetical protein